MINETLMSQCESIAREGIGRSSDRMITNKEQKIEKWKLSLYRKECIKLKILSVPSILEQNGDKRKAPEAIRMTEELVGVNKFDYDVDDSDFCKYMQGRTGIRAYVEFDEDVEPGTALHIQKQKQQDCWELYIGHVEAVTETVSVSTVSLSEKEDRMAFLKTTMFRKMKLI